MSVDIKQHVSITERNAWNKVIEDFNKHLGSRGTQNHNLAGGTNETAGFSQANFTSQEKTKLAGIENGALNNPHPATHPASMITGLANVAISGSWTDIINKPTSLPANGGNADTVGGIRLTIGTAGPSNPVNNKELWIGSNDYFLRIYTNNTWMIIGAVYS